MDCIRQWPVSQLVALHNVEKGGGSDISTPDRTLSAATRKTIRSVVNTTARPCVPARLSKDIVAANPWPRAKAK